MYVYMHLRICTSYVCTYGTIFTVPLETSWSEQFTISNKNVGHLLLLGMGSLQLCHKHVCLVTTKHCTSMASP